MTDYKSMFEQAVRTLAAIDEALGIGDDGCGDPDQTLTAIAELKDASQRGEALARVVMADQTAHDTCAADSKRWRWLIRYASLCFDGAPPWNAVLRLPVFDAEDQTITDLVDRALKVVGEA